MLEAGFKHLTHKFDSGNLLLKQKDAYPYEYMYIFERFSGKRYQIKKIFIGLWKMKQLIINEKLVGHINDEEYLTCIEIWNRFNMKNMVDYHDHYLKKVCYY